MIKNILSFLGFVFIVLLFAIVVKLEPAYHQVQQFDAEAVPTYLNLMQEVLRTGNAAEATVWKVPVSDGVSPEDAEDAMRSIANEHNIKNVGELPLSKQIEAMRGNPYRYLKIFMFCNPLTAAQMVDYSDAYSAYLPCRVTLIQDKQGKYWLYSLNMDLMIHGGLPLPPELKQEALRVKQVIQDIMQRGAKGEF